MDATSENIRIEKAIEFLEDLENIFEKDNSIVFKLLKIIYKKHIEKSKDVQEFPYFNIKNSSGEDAAFHVSRKYMIKLLKVFINYMIICCVKAFLIYFSNESIPSLRQS